MKNEQEIDDFGKLAPQLERLLKEFSELSKKKPNDAINKFKLGLVNKLLQTANMIVDDANRPFDDFDEFHEDALPTNSDVVVILSQYRECMRMFFDRNVRRDSVHDPKWVIAGKLSEVSAPRSYGNMV